MRGSGMLLPVASLPSKYGIGSFSKSAYEFVDLCAEAGQKYWQILPLGPTSYGDSPSPLINVVGIVSEITGITFLFCQKSFLNQSLQVNEIGISCKGGKGLIR